ncbi:class I SAM-dependent methyltransferase [Magnetovirga frankeli]|uniref:class I SAM-dependent methyltransferase n=1 Tax=Magnetovirga frankeli TaxID=947516 RepID=UPI001AF3BD91|nr:class I SAM-dependent methyltransferase [gamma proteobacterium SS-5]
MRKTPVHPQWLVFLQGHRAAAHALQQFSGTVLDIGCGNRWVESELNQHCRYLGLDYPDTVAMGYQGKPHLFGDGQNLPLQDASIDAILMLDVLEHMPKPAQAVAEATRVLKPGGVLLIQVPFLYPLHDEPYDFQRWTEHGLTVLMQTQGLECKRIVSHGAPIETSAALGAIALAKAVLDAVTNKRPSLLLAPLLISAIPILNISGWLLAKLMPSSNFMPLSYLILAKKPQ